MVVVFHNDGGLAFRPQVLYQAPHPNWGSSGMSLADLDGDGDTDILLVKRRHLRRQPAEAVSRGRVAVASREGT